MLVKCKIPAFQNGTYYRAGDILDIELPRDPKTKKPVLPQWAEPVPVISAAEEPAVDNDVLS